jgi:isoleucyl-tRNA synthetase
MYTASPPGNSRRFSTALVGETVRKFLNTLWNTYSFLVTYGNLSDWTPQTGASASENLVDRWVLSELNLLVRDVTLAMEAYDVLGATRPIADFVDNLSNWYVRLSRRRFWDGDAAALATLHHVLRTVSQLLAPTVPFIAEELWQNLAVKVDEKASDSVHLSHWPTVDEALIDQQLSEEMALIQRVASLGHSARQNANLKVRQPLAQVVLRARNQREGNALRRLQQFLLDELNVKELVVTDASDELVDVTVFPYPRQLGQKYGKGYPKIRAAIAAMDQFDIASRLQAGENVEVVAEGETFVVTAEDVEVRSTPRAGYSVSEAGGYLVAVTTELDPSLMQEGYAREVVRRIQQLRKDAGYAISDRITTWIAGGDLVHEMLVAWGDYIREETLSAEIIRDQHPEERLDLPNVEFVVGDTVVQAAIAKK